MSRLHIEGGSGTNINIKSTTGNSWRIGDAVGASDGTFVVYDYTNSRALLNYTNAGGWAFKTAGVDRLNIDAGGSLSLPTANIVLKLGATSSGYVLVEKGQTFSGSSTILYVGEPADTGANYFRGSGNTSFEGGVTVVGPAGLGYGTGSGGTVTQATSKSTAFALNKPSGAITLNASSMASGATEIFQFNNSLFTTADVLSANFRAGSGTLQSYNLWWSVGSGAVIFYLKNISGGALAEALIIEFNLGKGATA